MTAFMLQLRLNGCYKFMCHIMNAELAMSDMTFPTM